MLCMKESLEIKRILKGEPKRIINSLCESYRVYRHKQKFHRYIKYTTSTDTGQESPERVEVITVLDKKMRNKGRPDEENTLHYTICTVIIQIIPVLMHMSHRYPRTILILTT